MSAYLLGPRFVVRSVTGGNIDPSLGARGGGGGNTRPLPISYYVHDRVYCWKVVAAFEPPRSVAVGRALGDDERRRLALSAATEMNTWDREQGETDLPPIEEERMIGY